MAQQLKTCITCKEDKTLDNYSKASRRPDGKQPSCKACNKITNAKFREKRPAYQKKYYYSPTGHINKLKAQEVFWSKDGGGIYMVYNKINTNVYIGQTNKFKRREVEWAVYINNLEGFSRYVNDDFKKDIEKYGKENFVFEIVERMPDASSRQRKIRENFYIELFGKITNTYNKISNRIDESKEA